MSRQRAVRLGIVGCGAVVRSFHLPAIERVPGVTVVALADIDAERLATTAERWDVPGRHASHERLLAAGDAEAVLVALPPRAHVPVATDVLAAGRHLLLEKPIAARPAAARRLVARAEASGVVAWTAFNLRWHPYLTDLRETLASGELGPVETVRSLFTTSAGCGRAPDGWRGRPGQGGGVLHDLAVHHFDLAAHLFGGPLEAVDATGDDPEAAAEVEARLPGGVRFTGRYARAADEREASRLEVVGEDAALRLSFYGLDGLRIVPATGADPAPAVRARRGFERLARAVRRAPSLARGGPFRDSYVRQWEAFAGCVRGDRRPGCTLADGEAALGAAAAALRAAGVRDGASAP